MICARRKAVAGLQRIRDWWRAKLQWRRRGVRAVSSSLAQDLGVPPDVVGRVLKQTAADLRRLAEVDDASDARPIINKAFDELASHGCYQSHACDVAMMERCLEELPERELTILRHSKEGKKHREIAELMDTDVESVRRSLAKTYSDLRIKMLGRDPPTEIEKTRDDVVRF